jgi:hypothetical protein
MEDPSSDLGLDWTELDWARHQAISKPSFLPPRRRGVHFVLPPRTVVLIDLPCSWTGLFPPFVSRSYAWWRGSLGRRELASILLFLCACFQSQPNRPSQSLPFTSGCFSRKTQRRWAHCAVYGASHALSLSLSLSLSVLSTLLFSFRLKPPSFRHCRYSRPRQPATDPARPLGGPLAHANTSPSVCIGCVCIGRRAERVYLLYRRVQSSMIA